MKNFKRFIISFLLMFFLVNSIFLTGKINASAAEKGFVMINYQEINMVKGENMLLGTIWTGNGNVKWKVSDPKVVKIKPHGEKNMYCRAVAKKCGKVKITAVNPNKSKIVCTIEVFKERFTSKAILPIQKGKSLTINFKNGTGKDKASIENKKLAGIRKVAEARYSITGKKAGTTKMIVKSGKKILIYPIGVYE